MQGWRGLWESSIILLQIPDTIITKHFLKVIFNQKHNFTEITPPSEQKQYFDMTILYINTP